MTLTVKQTKSIEHTERLKLHVLLFAILGTALIGN